MGLIPSDPVKLVDHLTRRTVELDASFQRGEMPEQLYREERARLVEELRAAGREVNAAAKSTNAHSRKR